MLHSRTLDISIHQIQHCSESKEHMTEVTLSTTPRSLSGKLTPKHFEGDLFKVPAPRKKTSIKKSDLPAINTLLSLSSFNTPPQSPPGSPTQSSRSLSKLVKLSKDLYNHGSEQSARRKRRRDEEKVFTFKKRRGEYDDVYVEEVLETIAEDSPRAAENQQVKKERSFFSLVERISQPEVFTPELQRISVIASHLFSSLNEYAKKANLIQSFYENVFCVKLNMDQTQWTQLLVNPDKQIISALIARAVIVHANEDIYTNQFRVLNWRHIYAYTTNFNVWLTTVIVQPKRYLSNFPGLISANYMYIEELENEDCFSSFTLPSRADNVTNQIAGKISLFSATLPMREMPQGTPSSEEVIFKIL